MNRKLFSWISQLVKNSPGQTTIRSSSKIGLSVIEHYGYGRSQNNRLIFTAKDKNALRLQIKRELNIDPFDTEQLPDSRVDIAEFHDNEKLAKNPVSQDHILVNCPTGVVQLNNQKIHLHSDIIASVGFMPIASAINQINHDILVVVENLAIMQLCRHMTLPALCQNALWLYRGDHKSGAKAEACYDLLNRFGQDKEVIVFSDMDPKGLEIALTIPHANYWLGPETDTWIDCLKSRHASRTGYDIQTKAMKYLLDRSDADSLSKPINDLILLMRTEHSSYKQEHLYAHNIPLSLFLIKQPLC
jgi:hypothetical protein